jgi:hypothetical protein
VGVLAVIVVAATVVVTVLRTRPPSTTVTFEVTGSIDREMTIMWRVPGSASGIVTEKEGKVSRLPWSTTMHIPSREGVLFLNAGIPVVPEPPAASTSFTCRIAVNGHVVATGQADSSIWDAQCRTTLQQVFRP